MRPIAFVQVAFVLFSGCLSFKDGTLRLGPPSSSESTSPASSSESASPSAAPVRAAPAPGPSRFTTMPLPEFARLMARERLGQLHEVTEIKRSNGSREGVGTFAFSTYQDLNAVESRESAVYLAHFSGDTDGRRPLSLKKAMCRALFVEHEGLPESDADVQHTCEKNGGDFRAHGKLQLLMAKYVEFETFLDEVKDEAQVKAFRADFVKRLGWERETYELNASNSPNVSRWADRLVEVPLAKWSYRRVRFALAYAKKHDLGAAIIKELQDAQAAAPRLRCRLEKGSLFRDYEGGSSYGTPRYATTFYMEPTYVDCAEVKRIKTAAEHLKALPPMRPMDGLRWLAVKPTSDWEVYTNDFGLIKNKNMDVEVYWEEEF